MDSGVCDNCGFPVIRHGKSGRIKYISRKVRYTV